MAEQQEEHIRFQDHNQNFWQLAAIQSCAMGLPVILVGGQIAKQFGVGVAICSVLLGNLILWFIGLAIIGMTGKTRTNAIENVKRYLGQGGGIAAALVLVIAFLGWFTLQLGAVTTVAENFFNAGTSDIGLRLGAALGLLISLLSIGGIRLIKWTCVIALPILLFCSIFALIRVPSLQVHPGVWGLSASAVVSVVLILLPGIINLPTFFRHSRSRPHSFLALTVMTLLVSLFECFSIWTGISDPSEFFSQYMTGSPIKLNVAVGGVFVILSLICVNLVNIYFASAGWETIIRRAAGPKEYAIVGLAGTAVFTFIQITSPMEFLENLVNSFITSLGIVLLVAFLIRIVIRHRPRTLEKFFRNVCWFLGCVAALFALIQHPDDPNRAVLLGMGVSVFAFLVVLFVEETVWSIQQLTLKK